MSFVRVSPRFAGGTLARSQNFPARSGSAATEWLPVVTVTRCPRAPCLRSRFSASSMEACASSPVQTPFSNTTVSSPKSYAWNIRLRPIAWVTTAAGRLTAVRFRPANIALTDDFIFAKRQ